MTFGRSALAVYLVVVLSGCESREATMARCRMEALKITAPTPEKVAFAQACMIAAGYSYDASRCPGYGPLAEHCYSN